MKSQEENWLHFTNQVTDLRLKCCIPVENSSNNITGSGGGRPGSDVKIEIQVDCL
jgi:hypothetical protein